MNKLLGTTQYQTAYLYNTSQWSFNTYHETYQLHVCSYSIHTYQGLNGPRLTHSQSTLDRRRRNNFNFRCISIVCGGRREVHWVIVSQFNLMQEQLELSSLSGHLIGNWTALVVCPTAIQVARRERCLNQITSSLSLTSSMLGTPPGRPTRLY